MSDSDGEDGGQPGKGKVVQRHKRELKELQKQKELEAGKMTSFATSKRINKKHEVRQGKRDFEEKYRQLEQELRQRHVQELKALDEAQEDEGDSSSPAALTGEVAAGLGENLLNVHLEEEGTRKSKLQKKKERLAEIEKELREGAAA